MVQIFFSGPVPSVPKMCFEEKIIGINLGMQSVVKAQAQNRNLGCFGQISWSGIWNLYSGK